MAGSISAVGEVGVGAQVTLKGILSYRKCGDKESVTFGVKTNIGVQQTKVCTIKCIKHSTESNNTEVGC